MGLSQMTCTELTEQDDAPQHHLNELRLCRTTLVFGGVNTFEHEPERRKDRMMEISFKKKEIKVFTNAVIEE